MSNNAATHPNHTKMKYEINEDDDHDNNNDDEEIVENYMDDTDIMMEMDENDIDSTTSSCTKKNISSSWKGKGRPWGEVRATPYGSGLSSLLLKKSNDTTRNDDNNNNNNNETEQKQQEQQQSDAIAFHQYRSKKFTPLSFPLDGYEHFHGQPMMNQIDEHPLGISTPATTTTTTTTTTTSSPVIITKQEEEGEQQQKEVIEHHHHHDYGSNKTLADAPVGSLVEKWRLIPYFLRLRSLLRQHIDSYNYFVDYEMEQIVRAPSNYEIRSDHDPKFYLRYEACWVGTPSIEDDSFGGNISSGAAGGGGGRNASSAGGANRTTSTTPFQCRLRDCTYSAPIYVNVRYTRGHHTVVKRNVIIGRLPIMLRSNKCVLHNKSHDELAALMECPYDPGGYFIVKGNEKVILIQEQLSKNRVILEEDNSSSASISTQQQGGGSTSGVSATITSSTHERKSKAYIILKHGRVYLKSNSLGEDIPIIIVLKAMGIVPDLEIVQLVVGGGGGGVQDHQVAASEAAITTALLNALSLSLEEAKRYQIHTQLQALKYIGTKIQIATSQLYDNNNSSSGNAGGGGSYQRKRNSVEDEAREVLAHVVLSHVPVENYNYRPKAIYIGNIVRRVLLVYMKQMPYDDKDYYGNKRLELAGALISLLFEDLFKLFNTFLKRQADLVLSKPNQAQAFDIVKAIRPDTITNGMIAAIATGNWVLKRFRMDRAGVTQVLSRLSYMSALGMMTRINSQFEKTRKVSGPRSLQASQWGMLCPADTPEGEACGLVKNLALLAHITTDTNVHVVHGLERLCSDLGVEDVNRLTGTELNHPTTYLVFLNGLLLGIHTNPTVLTQNLRTMRRRGLTGEFISVYLHTGQRAVHIATDGGRVCRPLIIVDEMTGVPKLRQYHLESLASGLLDMKDLLRQGIVEYVDCNEENNTLIALTEKELELAITKKSKQQQKPSMAYTHLEVDPFTILGVIGGIIPYPHHNQAPRNTYTVAMAKQAMGTIAINAYERMDGLIYTKVYPQKIMVKSRTLDLVGFDHIPGGQNACIAVMSYSGYDIEDAIVMNKASIDRGYGRCMVLKKSQTSVRRYANGTTDRTCSAPDPNDFPDGTADKRYKKFRAIDQDGICKVGEKVEDGMYLVNKESPTDTTGNIGGADFGLGNNPLIHNQNVQYQPSGMSYRSSAPAYVDKVVVTCNEHTSSNHESFLIKIMTRQVRRPEIGDKFASRHGQKGVCGYIVPEVDLPFSEYGQVPDLIMNPHGFPSRMTIGKLLELVVGKAGLLVGRQGYSTAFGEEHGSADTHESASETLLRNGYNYQGKDQLYSGTNGEPLDAYIFNGPVFYQKLKHMVLDKAHARARGPRAVLTRQPTEGRSRDGGLRLGEMERDCLIAYGVSNLLMERLMHSSDAFKANVCLQCGLLQYQQWCQYCRSGENVVDIQLPYACKLLFQELQSMNVLPRLRLVDHS